MHSPLLRDGIAMLLRGVGVRLVPVHRELSTQEAADTLIRVQGKAAARHFL